ncbi:MAG TPA: hypothetical protein VKS79_15460 [Gemmataceae bacterium]|nr:hypothetical protein [Gemmataceae bacterium]
MKPRSRMAMALPGFILAIVPACMQMPPPSAMRQLAPSPQEPALANASAPPHFQPVVSRPVVSPYGPMGDVAHVRPDKPRRPAAPPEEEPEVETAALQAPARAPEVDSWPRSIKLVGSTLPTPPEPQAELQPEPKRQVATAIPLKDDPPLLQAMRTYVGKRPDLAVEMLKQFPPENQDALLILLPFTVRMSEGRLRETDPQELATMVEQLQQLQQLLQPMATLVLDQFCFCRQVRGFGNYEPLNDHPSFHSGELVELYAEIRNLSCEKIASRKNGFRTHVISKLEIRSANGSFVWKPHEREKDDYNQTPQHDYFHHYRFALPEMPAGEYSLFLEVTDVPTDRKVKRKLDFHVNR